MEAGIVAYQKVGTCCVYRYVYGFPNGRVVCESGHYWVNLDSDQIVAKWTIKLKGGIPKLDTPILSDEDVKDLND